MLQVFVAMLRAYQGPNRDSVRVSLDRLTRALPSRLQASDVAKAVRWTKRLAVEEGSSLPQLAHLWKSVVRNHVLYQQFYPMFAQQVVASLPKLSLATVSSFENRLLTVGRLLIHPIFMNFK